jgi:hypothetical protein
VNFNNICLAVAATQNYILEQYHKQDLQFEKAFYDDVRNDDKKNFRISLSSLVNTKS